MFTTKDVEKVKELVNELNETLEPIISDLTIPEKEYQMNWRYAAERRIKEGVMLIQTLNYLNTVAPWLESRGLVNINVITGFAPLTEVKVIDPGTGDRFSFTDVKTEKELKNIQGMGYEILEKIR